MNNGQWTKVSVLAEYRQQFPALTNKAYFNYGGQGPLPQTAIEAIHRTYDRIQQTGPFSGKAGDWVEQEVKQTRQAIASELGVAPQTITLTEDVTVGCNIPLWGIDWQAGDHLIVSDCEHPGIIAAIREVQRRFQLQVSIAPLMSTLNDGDPVAAIAGFLQPNTRLVVLSHILWNTGQVLPLEKIVERCRHFKTAGQPIRILVDAAQSVGVLPLNLSELGADFYAFTGHKWWCGPEGVGGLYVSPQARYSLNPTFIGWRGILKDKTGQPTGWIKDGRKFEIATSAYPLYAGLRESIALHQQWENAQTRYQQICKLSTLLWEKLAAIPEVTCLKTSPPEAGLVSFTLASQTHQQLVDFLETQAIMVRTIIDPNCVRASVHYLTTRDEIDRLVEGVSRFN